MIQLPQDFKEFLKLLTLHDDNIDGFNVNIISLKHLKINKKASGRFKDLDDLEHLGS